MCHTYCHCYYNLQLSLEIEEGINWQISYEVRDTEKVNCIFRRDIQIITVYFVLLLLLFLLTGSLLMLYHPIYHDRNPMILNNIFW